MNVLGIDIGYSNLKLAFGPQGSLPSVLLRPAGAAADEGPCCSQFVHLVFSSNGAGIVAGAFGREQGRGRSDSNPGSCFGVPVRTLVLNAATSRRFD